MARSLVLLVALLASLPTFAARTLELVATSLQTGENHVQRVPVNTPMAYTALFSWTAPGEAGVVEVDAPGTITRVQGGSEVTCSGEHPVRCTARPDIGPVHSFVSIQTTLTTPGPATATARLDTLVQTATVDVVDLPSLTTQTGFGHYRVEPGQTWQFAAETVNHGATATNVVLTAALTNGRITKITESGNANATCSFTDTVVTCTAATLPYNGFISVRAEFVASETRDGGTVHADAKATSDRPDFDPSDDAAIFEAVLVRHLAVTNANDDGAGSLRQAILDASVLCALDPCTVEFPSPMSIKLRSPLPDVRGTIKIDGGGHAELDGSALKDGAGLSLRDGCEMQVLGMIIRNFPAAGIDARRGTQPSNCNPRVMTAFPATAIARNTLDANERGIVVSATDWITIDHNVVTRSRRSGLFADATYYLGIRDNDFEHNGGSGMFLNPGNGSSFPGGADVDGNTLAWNGEWGIALTQRGDVEMLDNAIFGNRHLGIDVGLDFETPNVPDDITTTPNKPVLISAVYDPATNTTTVRGTLQTRGSDGTFTVQLFASARPGEGEEVVATQVWRETPPTELTFVVNRDLRGRYVTATHTRSHFLGLSREVPASHLSLAPADTSEFSNAIRVE